MTDLAARLAALRAPLARPQVRRRLRIAGLTLLAVGTVISVLRLDLAASDLALAPLLANLLIFSPVALLLAALTFRLTGAAVGQRIGNGLALKTVAAANVAELLPLPGGALVRGAVLVQAGADLRAAGAVVLQTAALTLTLAAGLAALALEAQADGPWGLLALPAFAGAAAVTVVLARRAGLWLALAMAAARVAGYALTVLRLALAFAALSHPVAPGEAAVLAAAPTLGAATGIFPAGLGMNEALAAALALMLDAPPATAFLAVALNTMFGLAASAACVAVLAALERRRL